MYGPKTPVKRHSFLDFWLAIIDSVILRAEYEDISMLRGVLK